MTNREILTAAAATVCESATDAQIEDYESRAPYILAAFCMQCKSVDRNYRRAYSQDPVSYPNKAVLALDEEFPLLPELVPAATFYLAAMLVVDENEKLSDKLLDLYTDAIATLAASLPAAAEKILNKYEAI